MRVCAKCILAWTADFWEKNSMQVATGDSGQSVPFLEEAARIIFWVDGWREENPFFFRDPFSSARMFIFCKTEV